MNNKSFYKLRALFFLIIILTSASIKAQEKELDTFFLTSDMLTSANPINLWDAIKLLVPSIVDKQEYLHGSDPNYVTNQVSLRNTSGWNQNTASMPIIILDGAIVSFRQIQDLDINDVENVIVSRQPLLQSHYGIKGSEGIIEVRTKKLQKGDVKVQYSLDVSFQKADLSSYNLMTSSQKLDYEKSQGLYNSNNNLLSEREKLVSSGVNTNWLKVPLHTAFINKHKLDVSGGDDYIKYKLSVRFSPDQQGIMKGSKKNTFGIGAQIEYRYKSLLVANNLTFDEVRGHSSNYGTFDYFSLINPYYETSLQPMLGNGSFNSQINPIYESSLSSFDKNKVHTIYDNLRVEFDLGSGFSLDGGFIFNRVLDQEDIYISPLSALYANITNSDNAGRYDILRNNRTTYEGKASLKYKTQIDKFDIGGTIGIRPYSAKYEYESFGGVGIPSDRMQFISFTKYYNPDEKATASRIYDHTFSSFVNGSFVYDNRYTLSFSLTMDKSSLLSKNKRTALFYGFGGEWNLKNEKFISQLNLFDALSLNAEWTTSGRVDFGVGDYTASYSSLNNDGSYNYFINNYPLIGVTIPSMPNEDLKWSTVTNRSIGLTVSLKKISLSVNYFDNLSSNLLTIQELALATGFSHYISNDGKASNRGVEYKFNANLLSKTDWSLNLFTSGVHNKYSIKNTAQGIYPLSSTTSHFCKDPLLSGNFGLSAAYQNWKMSVIVKYSIRGEVYNMTLDDMVENADVNYNLDKRAAQHKTYSSFIQKQSDISLGSVQLGYNFDSELCQKMYMKSLTLALSGNNLLYSSSIDMQRGIYYPYARSLTLSLKATF